MDTTMLQRLGVVEIDGADVVGGEFSPLWLKIGTVVFTAVIGSVAANWADFKDGMFEGYNDATH